MNIPIKADSFIKILKEDNYKKTDIKAYQQQIGKLIYLSCKTRLDITFTMRKLSKYNPNSRVGYLRIAKRIIHNLKGIMYLRLIYRKILKSYG